MSDRISQEQKLLWSVVIAARIWNVWINRVWSQLSFLNKNRPAAPHYLTTYISMHFTPSRILLGFLPLVLIHKASRNNPLSDPAAYHFVATVSSFRTFNVLCRIFLRELPLNLLNLWDVGSIHIIGASFSLIPLPPIESSSHSEANYKLGASASFARCLIFKSRSGWIFPWKVSKKRIRLFLCEHAIFLQDEKKIPSRRLIIHTYYSSKSFLLLFFELLE